VSSRDPEPVDRCESRPRESGLGARNVVAYDRPVPDQDVRSSCFASLDTLGASLGEQVR
jgi:hypothetical protein